MEGHWGSVHFYLCVFVTSQSCLARPEVANKVNYPKECIILRVCTYRLFNILARPLSHTTSALIIKSKFNSAFSLRLSRLFTTKKQPYTTTNYFFNNTFLVTKCDCVTIQTGIPFMGTHCCTHNIITLDNYENHK